MSAPYILTLNVTLNVNLGALRRKFYIKLLAGPLIWEGRLIEFVNVFTNRKKQFEFAMAIHTTVGVGVAIRKMDVVDERTAELSQRCVVFL